MEDRVDDHYTKCYGRGSGGDHVDFVDDDDWRRSIPKHIRDACWKAAEQTCGKRRYVVTEEYDRRLTEYQRRKAQQAHDRRERASAQRQRDEAMRSYGLTPTNEVLTADPVVIEATKVLEEVDDWEQLAEDDKSKVPVAEASNPAKARTYKAEYVEANPTFELPHGHPVLAESRKYGDQAMRMRAIAAALTSKTKRPVVVDVGAGASGVKNAVAAMTGVLRADRVYHHCIFPIAAAADVARDHLMRARDVACMINWVDEENEPKLGLVNVCRHTAATCTCLKWYDERFVFTCHSHYYFTQEDWHNLFKYTESVRTHGHYPTALERGTPAKKPEFVWRNWRKAETISWLDAVRARLRQAVTGLDDLLVFEPYRTHGTTYAQRDPRDIVAAGGFHMLPWWQRKLISWSEMVGPLFMAEAADSMGVGCALYGFARFAATRSLGPLAGWFGFAVLLGLPKFLMRTACQIQSSTEPPRWAEYTVKVVNVNAVKYEGEEIAHFYDYMKSPLMALERRRTDSYEPDVEVATQLAAVAALSSKPEAKVREILAARCLREGMPAAQASDTIKEAMAIVTQVVGKNEVVLPQHGPPQLHTQELRCVWGFVGLTAATVLSFTPVLGYRFTQGVLASAWQPSLSTPGRSEMLRAFLESISAYATWEPPMGPDSLAGLLQMDRPSPPVLGTPLMLS